MCICSRNLYLNFSVILQPSLVIIKQPYQHALYCYKHRSEIRKQKATYLFPKLGSLEDEVIYQPQSCKVRFRYIVKVCGGRFLHTLFSFLFFLILKSKFHWQTFQPLSLAKFWKIKWIQIQIDNLHFIYDSILGLQYQFIIYVLKVAQNCSLYWVKPITWVKKNLS